jgi:hypothetical protein
MRLLTVCLFALFIVACKPKPSATIVADPGLMTLVPSDTVFLAGIRMEPLRSTPVYQKYVAQQKIEWVEEFRKETGLDPTKDLWEFLITSNGKDTAVFTRGQFSEMGMEPKLKREGIQRMGYKGYTLLGDEANAVAFINSSTAIVARTPYVKTLIDRRGTGASGAPKWLMDRVKQIPSTNQLWFTGAGDVPTISRKDAGNMANLNMLIERVQSFTGGMDFRTGAKTHVEATCDTEADAEHLAQSIKGLVGMGRLSTPTNQRDLLRVYDAVKVEFKGKQVNMDMDLPQDLVDQLVTLGNSVRPRTRTKTN